MLPEISRRCLACGASVRTGGRFCQQCGAKLGDASAETEPEAAGDGATGATAAKDAAVTNEAAAAKVEPEPPSAIFRRPQSPARPTVTPGQAGAAPPAAEKPAPAPPAPTTPAPAPPSQHDNSAPRQQAAAVAGVEARSPAAVAAKGRRAAAVRESLRPRVERVRDASMGVIEEASEDTGLRFVLISVVLFLLFLFLLLLNYVLS